MTQYPIYFFRRLLHDSSTESTNWPTPDKVNKLLAMSQSRPRAIAENEGFYLFIKKNLTLIFKTH